MAKNKKDEKVKDYNPTEKETEALELVQEFEENARSWQDDVYRKLMRYYYLYRGYQMEESYPWRNNISLPIAFSTIETLIPRIFSNQPKVSIQGTSIEGKKYLDQSKAILNYDFFNRDFNLELIDWFKRTLIYGTSVLKIMFKEEDKVVRNRSIVDKIKGVFKKEPKTVKKQYIDIASLPPFHFKIDDPQTKYIRDAECVSHDVYLSEEEVKQRRSNQYDNTECVQGQLHNDDYCAAKWELMKKEHQDRGRILEETLPDIGSGSSFRRKDLVKVTEYYFKRTNEYPLGRLIVVANDDIILKDDINPYWYIEGEFPFIETKDQPVPGEFYGVGEVEAVEPLIYERNHIRNRRLDSSEQSADKMWWVNEQSDVDEGDLVWRPSGIVHGVAGEEFGVVKQGETATTPFKEEEMVAQDIREASGISSYSKGVGKKYDTATTTMTLISESNKRIAHKIQLMGEMGIARLAQMILEMEAIESSGTRMGKILGKGEKFIPVKTDEISSEYNFKVSMDPFPLINRQMRVEQLTQVLQVLPEGTPGRQLVIKEMLKTVGKGEFDENEIDKILGMNQPAKNNLPQKISKNIGSEVGRQAKAQASVAGGEERADKAQPTRPSFSPQGIGKNKKIPRKFKE